MKYTPAKIFKLYEGWKARMGPSWERGNKNLLFVEKGEQHLGYDASAVSRENLVFNMANKFLKTVQANAKDIDISLSLRSPLCDTNPEEKKSFSMIINQIMLKENNLRSIQASLDKVYSFGQAVFHVKNVRENEDTLNQVLEIENIEDVTSTFFDYGAMSPTYHDGNFCGRIYYMDREKLRRLYKDLENVDLPQTCEVADFWYKARKKEKYFLLNTGEYKREDLIDPLRDFIKNSPPKNMETTRLRHLRAVQGYDKFIEQTSAKSKGIPVNILPMVLNYGGMCWLGKDNGYESFPFGYHLWDSQLLLNYSGSTAADILKSVTADKWLFGTEHVDSTESFNSANEINEREGAFLFTGNTATIRREVSQQLPPAVVEVFNQTRTMMQDIAGSYFEGGSSKIKAVSGVALDKLFERIDLTQNNTIVAHLNTVNVLGEVVKKFIPICYHENRKLLVCNSDGEKSVIEINRPVPQPGGGEFIENNVKDLCKHYSFDIDASPSAKLQSQNIKSELDELYTKNRQYMNLTVDIYTKNLDIPNADIISRRLSTQIPKELIDYGNGKITEEQYQQITQQKAQQQQQAQEQAMMNSPQVKFEGAKVQADISRAKSEAFRAETDRLKEHSNALNNHIKSVSGAANVQFKDENEKAYIELQSAKDSISHAEKIINQLIPRDK